MGDKISRRPPEMSFLLVGRTRYGRSATGNSILCQKVFKVSQSSTSCTKSYLMKQARVQGHEVTTVDSPGLADTDMIQAESIQLLHDEVKEILSKKPDGFDAILITIPHAGGLTQEDNEIFEILENCFGETSVKDFGIVVLTHADDYNPEEHNNMSLEEFTRQQTGVMADILKICPGRLVCFDNRTQDRRIRIKQVKCLLETVVNMKKSTHHFTEKGLGIFDYAKTYLGSALGTSVTAASIALAPFTSGTSLAVGVAAGAFTGAAASYALHATDDKSSKK